jgi:hypothetical protein
VALLAVVSVAARSGDHDRAVPGGSLLGTTGHHAVVWVLLVVGPIAAVLGLGIFLYAQIMRRRDTPEMAALRRRRRIRNRILLAAVVVLLAYSYTTGQNPLQVLSNLLHDLFGNVHMGRLNPFNSRQAPVGGHGPVRHNGSGVSLVDWVIAGLTWLLIVAGVAVAVRRLRRRPEPEALAVAEADA